MSAAEKLFVTNAMIVASRVARFETHGESHTPRYCCERAGIAAAFRAKNAEITDEQIIEALNAAINGPERNLTAALRKLFLGVEVSA